MDVTVLKALADERRLEILKLLSGGERCLCEISGALGVSDALASHHVKRLAAAGFVRTRRKGLWLHCSLNASAMEEVAEQLRVLGAHDERATPAAGGDSDVECCARAAKSGGGSGG